MPAVTHRSRVIVVIASRSPWVIENGLEGRKITYTVSAVPAKNEATTAMISGNSMMERTPSLPSRIRQAASAQTSPDKRPI